MSHTFTLKNIRANSINFRVAVEGSGPLVIMVHGWPELWYSWRQQIMPVADAGYKVVVPDVRGYGGSDKPHAVEAYDMKTLMADIIGLIDYFGEDQAILFGHDWGAPICWNTSSLYPERIAAVAGLSIPHFKRGAISDIALWNTLYTDRFFYQLYFQKEGVAEAELELDVRTSLRKIYHSISGDASSLGNRLQGSPGGGMLEVLEDPDPFPNWMKAEDLDYFVAQFSSGGFRGPLNRYRNSQRDFELLPKMGTVPIIQPACFIAGSKDVVRHFVLGYDPYEDPGSHCTDLRVSRIIEGKGHWIQQEAPDQVNAALLEFLDSLH